MKWTWLSQVSTWVTHVIIIHHLIKFKSNKFFYLCKFLVNHHFIIIFRIECVNYVAAHEQHNPLVSDSNEFIFQKKNKKLTQKTVKKTCTVLNIWAAPMKAFRLKMREIATKLNNFHLTEQWFVLWYEITCLWCVFILFYHRSSLFNS